MPVSYTHLEVMELPEQAEDQVYYQLLKMAGKSMLEQIGEVERERLEYKEYICLLYTSFQSFIIQSKTFLHVFFENVSCPDSERCATLGFYTIADINDNIKIIVVNLIGFSICRSCCKICNLSLIHI